MATRAYFYFDNHTEKGTVTTTSEHSDYPKENLQDRDKHTFWRPGNATTPQQIDFDLGSAMQVQALIIAHDNLYTKNVGLKLIVDSNDQAGFPNPQYIIGSSTAPHDPTADDQPLWYERLAFALTKRYWRVELYTGGQTDILVGDIYLCPEVDLGRHPGGPWKLGFDDPTRLVQAEGALYGVTTRSPAREIDLEAVGITKSVTDEILAGYQIVRAGFLPFIYVDEYGRPQLVRFRDPPSAKHHIGPYWEMRLRMVTEV